MRDVVAQPHGPGEEVRLEAAGRRPAAHGGPPAPRAGRAGWTGEPGRERRLPARRVGGSHDRGGLVRDRSEQAGVGRAVPTGIGGRGRRGGHAVPPEQGCGAGDGRLRSLRRPAASDRRGDDGVFGRATASSGERTRPPSPATSPARGDDRRTKRLPASSGARRRPPVDVVAAPRAPGGVHRTGRRSRPTRPTGREPWSWWSWPCWSGHGVGTVLAPGGGVACHRLLTLGTGGGRRLGRHGQVSLRKAQGLQIGPGRLLRTTQDDTDPDLAADRQRRAASPGARRATSPPPDRPRRPAACW